MKKGTLRRVRKHPDSREHAHFKEGMDIAFWDYPKVGHRFECMEEARFISTSRVKRLILDDQDDHLLYVETESGSEYELRSEEAQYKQA